MLVAAAVLLVAAVVVWVAWPLAARRRSIADPEDPRLQALLEEKHAVYQSILDLEQDRALDKVSDADYLVLRRQQEADALALLRQMDDLAESGPAAPADVLEREIAEARARLKTRR